MRLNRWVAGVGVLLQMAGAARVQALPAQTRQSAAGPVVFDSVTIVDVVAGKLVPGQRVVIVGNRIQAAGSLSSVRLPEAATVVNAQGKYLIPGLWDMHVHVWTLPEIYYPLFLANGVTGIREMSQQHPIDSLLLWRREILAGERVGPRVVGTGGFLASKGEPPLMIEVTTPEEARRAVDSLKAAGADFIKIRDGLSREVYFAIANQARRVGIPLVGHRSTSVTVRESSDSGQRTIEHHALVRECSESDTAYAGPDACKALVEHLVRNNTWITPTMAFSSLGMGDQLYKGRERADYWPKTVRDEADASFMSVYRQTMAKDGPRLIANWQAGIRGAQRFGAPFLAGTDAAAMVWEVAPGFSLHDELVFLVQGGLTPLEALQAATLNPAKALNATDSLGTVGAGKLADLLLLDANPLDDIRNTTTIRAVVANGRYYDRAALDRVLADVRANAE